MKCWLVPFLLLSSFQICQAQRIDPSGSGGVSAKARPLTHQQKADTVKVRLANHYLGLQANQLVNQLFNFGGNAPAVHNPYLLIYSVNSSRSGIGLNTGLGYIVHSTNEQSDPNTTRTSDIKTVDFRFGIEKKSTLGKHWLASYGFDILTGNDEDHTKTESRFQFGSNTTDSKSTVKYGGCGPRVAITYFISDRIALGTEASYYYKSIKLDQHTTNTNTQIFIDPNTGQTTQQTSSFTTQTSQESTDFVLSVPVALFLIVKL